MKRILLILTALLAVSAMQAQKISHIETTASWHFIYDENGKRLRTIGASQGQVVAYSEAFYILKNGPFYHTYDAKGKKLHTFHESNVGDVLNASGDTFTSRKGNWIITWDKNGRKISTRHASN